MTRPRLDPVSRLLTSLSAWLLASGVCAAQPAQLSSQPIPSAQVLSVADSQLHNPLVFVIYGDMRFTDASETIAASPGPRQALVERVAAEHPDALFLTGDIPWHGGDTHDYRVFAQETAVWQQQHLRVYPVLGNHEFSQCDDPQCLANWWAAFPQINGWRWYAVALGTSVRALALDSNDSLLPGSDQRQWLERELGNLPQTVRFLVITLHHPPVADTGLLIVRRNERALARYLKSVARGSSARFIVCSGHVHNYERFERDGVVYLVSGGGGAKPLGVHRDRADRYREPTFPNFHYLRFELQGERLQVQMQRVMDYQAASPREWAVEDRFEVRAKPQP